MVRRMADISGLSLSIGVTRADICSPTMALIQSCHELRDATVDVTTTASDVLRIAAPSRTDYSAPKRADHEDYRDDRGNDHRLRVRFSAEILPLVGELNAFALRLTSNSANAE